MSLVETMPPVGWGTEEESVQPQTTPKRFYARVAEFSTREITALIMASGKLGIDPKVFPSPFKGSKKAGNRAMVTVPNYRDFEFFGVKDGQFYIDFFHAETFLSECSHCLSRAEVYAHFGIPDPAIKREPKTTAQPKPKPAKSAPTGKLVITYTNGKKYHATNVIRVNHSAGKPVFSYVCSTAKTGVVSTETTTTIDTNAISELLVKLPNENQYQYQFTDGKLRVITRTLW